MNDPKSGKITQIIGTVVDVYFEEDLPNILDILIIDHYNIKLEVQQHVGNNVVKTLSLSSTDGLCRGLRFINTKKKHFLYLWAKKF